MVNNLPKLILLGWVQVTLGLTQENPKRFWQPVQEYFTIVTPQREGRQKREHRVNPFLSYTHLGTDFGFVGPAEAAIGWQPGMVCATLPANSDGWAGMWHSLNRLARLPGDTLNFQRCYPAWIGEKFQPRIVGLRMNVMGRGEVKIDIRGPNQEALWSHKFSVTADRMVAVRRELLPEKLGAAKFLTWVAEPGSDFCIDNVGFEVEPPALDFDLYVFLVSYAKAARCYSSDTGLARDRAHTEDGAFDSIPATGLFALSTATAAKLGIVTLEFSRMVLRRALDAAALLEGPHGLLPHFARRGERGVMIHPGTEYSTVDTSIFYHGTLLAAQILADEELIVRARAGMKRTDFASLRNAEGYVSHGVGDDGQNILPYIWRDWGGETALVLLHQQYASEGRLTPMMADTGRVHQGCGFIADIQSLFYPDFDQQFTGILSRINWRESRERLLRDQKSYFQRTQSEDGFARRHGIYGLSSGEGAYGRGYHVGGVDLPHQTLIHPHYILLSATLESEPQTVYGLLKRMQSLDLLPPWGLVENVLADGSEHVPLQGALNANFEALGAYHLMAKSRGSPDIIHRAATDSPDLRQAIAVFNRQPPL
ncbi:MAG: hypothetical protein ACR2OZ_15670 [Verrucomicrobiales bacterium]